MALTSCRECGQKVSTEAPNCPGCGAPNPGGNEPGDSRTVPARNENSGMSADQQAGCLFASLLVLACIAVVVASTRGGLERFDTDGISVPRGSRSEARIICERYVSDRLRSPSTADFQQRSEQQVNESGGAYTISAHVDAQNRFGATVRQEYECQVRPTADGWSLDSLTFEQ